MTNRIRILTWLGPFCAAVMVALAALLSIWNLIPSNILYTDDAAFSIGLAKTILRGEVLLQGVPSHLGGRNLGPWYNYIVAICLAVSGHNLTWTFRLLALINLCGFGFSAWLALKIAPALTKWWAIFGVSSVIIGAQYLWVIRVPWMPNFLLVPAALCLVATWLVVAHGPKFLLPLICAASFCLQTHMSSLPMIAGLGAVALLSTFRREISHSWHTTLIDNRRWHLCWGALLIALWLPLVIYELEFGGNISRLIHIHSKVVTDRAGMGMALELLFSFLKTFLVGDLGAPELFAPLPAWVGYILFLALLITLVRHVLRTSNTVKWFWLAVFSGVLLTVIALARLKPPIHTYYFNSMLGAVVLWAGVMLSEAVHSIFLEGRKSHFLRAVSIILISLSALALTHSAKYNFDLYTNQPFPTLATLEHAAQVASAIEADRRGEPKVEIYVHGQQSLRAGAFYSLLNGDYFPPMMYADKCIELPSVRAYNELNVKNKKTDAKIAYLMNCPAVSDISAKKYWRKMDNWWTIDALVPLTSCSSCAGCSLTRLRRNSTGADT